MRVILMSLVAGALGVSASVLLGVILAPPERLLVAGDTPPAPLSPGRTLQEYLDGILGRNLFDPSRIGEKGGGPRVAVGSLTLLGTAVAEPVTLSSALIADAAADGLPGTYSLGYAVGDRLVVAIHHEDVELRAPDGTIEVLRWEGTVGPAPAPTPDGRIRVSRAELEAINGAALANMAQAQVHQGPDGPDGIRLAGVRKNTLPYTLGLRNGDVVHAVGEYPLTSLAHGMAAFAALRDADELCVDLTRRGEATRLCYAVE